MSFAIATSAPVPEVTSAGYVPPRFDEPCCKGCIGRICKCKCGELPPIPKLPRDEDVTIAHIKLLRRLRTRVERHRAKRGCGIVTRPGTRPHRPDCWRYLQTLEQRIATLKPIAKANKLKQLATTIANELNVS